MKPNFALDLSHEGITLLHRGAEGWHTVGSVSLDDTEFSEKLGFLRQTATALETGGLTTKLVIPNSQIRFITADAPGPSEEERDEQIRAALDGATPYDIDDLAYDWSEVDGNVNIAAVAHETLAEAEAFANEHGFNPVSFVATPKAGTFSSAEPFFGTSISSQALLDPSDSVEPDSEAIRIIGPAITPDQNTEPLIEDEPEPDSLTVSPTTETSGPKPDPAPDADTDEETPALTKDTPPVDETAETTPPVTDVTSPQLPEMEDDTADITAPAFISKRDGNSVSDDDQALSRIENIETRLAILPEGTSSLAPKLGGMNRKHTASKPEPVIPAPASSKKSPAPEPLTTKIAPPPPLPETEAVSETAQSSPGPDLQTEEQAMTVFGARKKPVQRGKPRYLGLSLMLLLLAVLAAIVLWSTFFLNEKTAFWRGNQNETVTSPSVSGTAPTPETTETSTSVSDALALLTEPTIRHEVQPQTPPDPLSVASEDTEAAVAQETPPPAPLPTAPTPLTPQNAQAAYLDTGIWQRAPKAPISLREDEIESLYITSIDPQITSQDAIALPGFPTSGNDLSLELQSTPAAHSAAFVLDERGLVVPSPEGTLTPDGVMVFSGPPPTKPKERGNRVPQVIVEPDLRLAGFKPQARPADLVQQTHTAQETEQLGGYTRTQLAALRPKPRPYEVSPPQNEEPVPEVDGEAIAAAVALAEAEAQANAGTPAPISTSPLAVVLSSAPKHRPRNFAKLVERTRASAPSERATAAAAVPRKQTVTPSAPTRASVARLATTKNAINLRRTSLIGVYGSPSKRRALVRLSNGRYVKVQVGQRVDGGKVAAIGQSELRYVKGGRTIILRMPKS